MEHQINIKWDKLENFIYQNKNQTIHLGSEDGVSPKKLLLVGLAGCTGIDLVSLLNKMRVKFDNLEIKVEANLTDEHPKIYNEITIHYIVSANKTDQEKIEKAISLSLEKYCGVSAMLGKSAEIKYNLILNN